MKTIVLVLAMVLTATMAMATEQCPPPPCPECQPVQVTCNCAGMELEGLYKVNIAGVMRCGKITIIQNGFLLEEGGPSIDITPTSTGGKVFFLSNAWKRLERVPVCD